MLSAAYVYEGVWVDWDRGRLSGARITLSSLKTGILAALIAIFIAACGEQLWKETLFVLHQWRVGRRPSSIEAEIWPNPTAPRKGLALSPLASASSRTKSK